MSSKDVEEALRKNRNLQNILNQRLARIQQAIEKNKKEMNLVKSSKPKTIFKMLISYNFLLFIFPSFNPSLLCEP